MLTFEQIKDLIDQVASHRLSGFELERAGFRLKIDGQTIAGAGAAGFASPPTAVSPADAMPANAARVTVAAEAPVPAAAPPAPEPVAESLPADVHVLNSPIVGTFYRAPNPDAPSFVEVGDRVESGQVLCIVEAMKLMNEIESDAAGTIVEIYVENAQPVEYGEPLFAIKAG